MLEVSKNGSGSSSICITDARKFAAIYQFQPTTEARTILYCIDDHKRGWIGGIGEIIGLSTTSSRSDRQKIDGYLAQKWGLAGNLPASHPYQLKNGADLTLYWGANDGGEDENSWDNAVSLGKKSSPLAVWFDASDLDADGITDTNASVDITVWKDKSGNNRHASGGNALSQLHGWSQRKTGYRKKKWRIF